MLVYRDGLQDLYMETMTRQKVYDEKHLTGLCKIRYTPYHQLKVINMQDPFKMSVSARYICDTYYITSEI